MLAALGALVVVTGWLPTDAAVDIGVHRAGPILGFLVAVTVLAELADKTGVFDIAAGYCARLGRGSIPLLFALIAALATTTTVAMSLDTTAVLLTPVVLATADRLGLPAAPFSLLVVWLANTASLLLPVSNLTNLLAVDHTGITAHEFARQMALPQLVAVALTVGFLGLVFRRRLRGRYPVPAPTPPPDRVLSTVCALACAGFAVAVTAGVPPWAAATVAAAIAAAGCALRAREHLRPALLPWRLVVTTEGLFLVVSALLHHGLGDVLTGWTGRSELGTVFAAAAAANLVNNLPAYLAMETTVPAGSADHIFPVLLGTNIGPLVTMWGSLATLLWADRCRARGVHIGAGRFALLATVGVPPILLATWAVSSW
ncbi:SLC13 family permease [Nocardia sp. NBC_00416]|uniref:SLC13 family permease n=1 Tax=Nocardia sp. NBC_00416 TaxID=2975991 RepID=UPI002E1B5896